MFVTFKRIDPNIIKAIESLRIQDQLSEDQVAKLIETLVENQGLRDIILKR